MTAIKYIVLDSFKAQTKQGEIDLQPGQIITLPHEAAIDLLNEGKIKPVEKTAYRIYSSILQAYLWVVDTHRDLHTLRGRGIKEPVYTLDEIRQLKGIDKDGLKDIHKVKEVFEESTIVEVKRKT